MWKLLYLGQNCTNQQLLRTLLTPPSLGKYLMVPGVIHRTELYNHMKEKDFVSLPIFLVKQISSKPVVFYK